MDPGGLLRTAATLVVVLALAAVARRAAKALHQPPVIGEIAGGLLAGPLCLLLAGRAAVDAVLPGPVLDLLHVVGEIGLALFLLGLAHRLRPARTGGRTLGWVVAGTLIPSVGTGLVLALWVLGPGSSLLSDRVPAAALVLLLMAALGATAVPVLARILADRGMLHTTEGNLGLTAAIAVDAVVWVLVAAALGAAEAGRGRVGSALATLAAGVALTVVGRLVLRTGPATRFAGRHPVVVAIPLAAFALLAAWLTSAEGLTIVLGAVLAGLLVPRADGWTRPVRLASGAGVHLVPVFFFVTGVTATLAVGSAVPWLAIVVSLVLACAGKLSGTYAGARLGGLDRRTSVRLGVLMNTKGLTEIVILQAGLQARILSPAMFLALMVVALISTAATGPLLSLTDSRAAARHEGATP
jgi:Kef-type K+ transport system membrane component KefB